MERRVLGWTLTIAAHLTLAGVVLHMAAQPVATADVARWAASHGFTLQPDDPGHQLTARYLRRGRLFRTAGFAAGLMAGLGALIYWGAIIQRSGPPHLLGIPFVWAVGYLLGAIVVELSRPPPRPWRGLHGAALAPRRLGDYLPGWLLVTERLAALAVLALPAVMIAVPRSQLPNIGIGDRWVITNGSVAAVLATLLEVTLRAMVHRAQPVASASDLALDDVVRSISIYRTAAAGLALQLLVLRDQIEQASWAWQVKVLHWPAFLLGLACLVLAIRVWSNAGQPGWPVRRGMAPRQRPQSGQEPA
jgi:TRAP-type C4-dicarboxylate transport system permease large subunit